MSFDSLFDYDGTAQAPTDDELVFLPHANPEDWARPGPRSRRVSE